MPPRSKKLVWLWAAVTKTVSKLFSVGYAGEPIIPPAKPDEMK